MPLAAGTRLGPYELIAPVGAGGMGEVYRARDTRLDRIVAVKVAAERFSERFEREARVVASLNHSNICQVYDVGPNYLVMEFIEGVPLEGPLPVERAVRLACLICDALDAAHKKGITHRDLKPANILVTATGLKLLDFGLAQMEAPAPRAEDATQAMTLTQAGTILGTVCYMSPEQAEAKPVDARSDIFSFGLVLYEMLSGRRAFPGDSPIAVLAAILNQEPAPLDGSVPLELRDIVARCLRKSRNDRFQSARDLRAALESASLAKAPDDRPSIAVLPFSNMSRDEDNEYFSDGLSEEIINVLAQIPGLKVIARTSAFAFRGKEQDIRKIAEALGVRTVLEGSVRRSGNRIRVTAQLITAEDGSHLWSERYDREMADVFALQDEIAAAIAAALRIKLAVQPAARQYTPNLAAYEALLRAWHHVAQYTPESMTLAREYLEKAAALDPGYAATHSTLAMYFNALPVVGVMSAHEATPLARAAAERALAIDPDQPEALATLGWIRGAYDYDWNDGERLFRRALAHHQATPKVHWYAGHYELALGRIGSATEQIELALQSDPLNVAYRRSLAYCKHADGLEDEVVRECGRILELSDRDYWAYLLLTQIHEQRGQIEAALQSAQKAYSLAPWYLPVISTLAAMLQRSGDHASADAMLGKLADSAANGVPVSWMNYYLLVQKIDLAADWAAKAIEQRDALLRGFLLFPYARKLRRSARWPELAKKMNLSERFASRLDPV